MADRFEEIKRALIVFIKERTRRYKEQQQKVIDEEGGYFSPHIKTSITNFEKEVCKLESKIPTVYCYSERNAKKTEKLLFDVYFRKACKVEDENKEDKVVMADEVKAKLGVEGYELMKEYFSIKAAILCLIIEIKKERRPETETLLKRFNSIKRFWEKTVLI